jgi:hypothetical protein
MKNKLEEEARKKRTDPVYSNTYTSMPNLNNFKSERFSFLNENWEKDWDNYTKTMESKLIVPENKVLSLKEKSNPCCSNPEKYKNGFNTLKFWSCKNCGADLGDIND